MSCEREAVSDTLLAATPVSNDPLAYVKMYIFANKYLINPLVSLTYLRAIV